MVEDIEYEYRGCQVKIEVDYDPGILDVPWVEYDGHGIISEWEHRPKGPGERILVENCGARMFYNVQQTQALALRDGWGVDPQTVENYESLTRRQIAALAVDRDFEYCRQFATGERFWLVASYTIRDENGDVIAENSVCGYDDAEYAVVEMRDEANYEVDESMRIDALTQEANNYP